MLETVSATQARVHFGELLQRVIRSKKAIIVERAGKPLAVILSMDEYERLSGPNEEPGWKTLVQQAREQIRAELGDRELLPADEIIRLMREERNVEQASLR